MSIQRVCCLVFLVASFTRHSSADHGRPDPVDPSRPHPAAPDPKEAPMTDSKAPIHKAPPPPPSTPAEDTARYVAWMAQRGTPIKDKPREDVNLRVGDWGFFDHGNGPGQFQDRAGLDRAGHAIVPSEHGAWRDFLATKGLDAATALDRIAWLFSASALDPSSTTKVANRDKITAPTLATAKDGTITFQGWLVFPPNMGSPMRMTIKATASGATMVNEPAKKL